MAKSQERRVKGVYLLVAGGEECLQVLSDTDRYGRGGGDAGGAAVVARLAVCRRGRVQRHGVFGHAALPAVIGRGEGVRRGELGGDAVLWGWGVLGRGVGLGHGVRGVGGLLVTLVDRWQKNNRMSSSSSSNLISSSYSASKRFAVPMDNDPPSIPWKEPQRF